MTDETESLILEHLRLIRAAQGAMREGISELKHWLSAIRQTLCNLQIQVGQALVLMGSMNKRIDRIEDRMDYVDQKLERLDRRSRASSGNST